MEVDLTGVSCLEMKIHGLVQSHRLHLFKRLKRLDWFEIVAWVAVLLVSCFLHSTS